jgi:hypothetical protein
VLIRSAQSGNASRIYWNSPKLPTNASGSPRPRKDSAFGKRLKVLAKGYWNRDRPVSQPGVAAKQKEILFQAAGIRLRVAVAATGVSFIQGALCNDAGRRARPRSY